MIRSKIHVPYAGEKVKDCELVRWHREDGSVVELGALIATLESKKVITEMEADHAGILRHIAREGETLALGACFAVIEHDGLRRKDGALCLTMEISDEDLAVIDLRRGGMSRDEYALWCLREMTGG